MSQRTEFETAAIALCERINPEITRRMLAAHASVEQLMIAMEAQLAVAPPEPQNVVEFRQPQPLNPFSFDAPGAPTLASVIGFGRAFDAEYSAGERMAKSLVERGYGPSHAGLRNIA